MKWLKITVVLFLVTRVKSGPTRSEVDPEPGKELTIKSMIRNSAEQFTFTLTEITPAGPTHTDLVIKDNSGESEYEAQETAASKTFTFLKDLKDLSGQSNVGFLLAVLDEGSTQLAYAYKEIHKFPEFPGTLTAKRLDDPRKPKDVISRVEGSLGTWILEQVGTLITEEGDIHYYQEKESPDYTPCTEEDGVTICDITFEYLISTTGHDEILTSAVLSYGPGNQATVKLTAIAKSPDILDAILMPLPSTENKLCNKDQIGKSECTIKWNDPSEDSLEMVIVQKTKEDGTETETWTTRSIVIHDRKLLVNQLGADIIEGRWMVLDDEYSPEHTIKSIYRMRINGDGKEEKVDVDCSNLSLEPKLCFGYFPKLTTGEEYTLTVAYKKNDKYNDKDQIESSPVTIKSMEPELEILSRHTTRHQNQLMTEVKICFQHLTPAEGRSFSHYEMLIINEKGQWLKHRILEEKEDEEEASKGGLCFASFPINTEDFDLTDGTKVVVSQRGVDGVTVLATAESPLF